jgi:hypothetical protein
VCCCIWIVQSKGVGKKKKKRLVSCNKKKIWPKRHGKRKRKRKKKKRNYKGVAERQEMG